MNNLTSETSLDCALENVPAWGLVEDVKRLIEELNSWFIGSLLITFKNARQHNITVHQQDALNQHLAHGKGFQELIDGVKHEPGQYNLPKGTIIVGWHVGRYYNWQTSNIELFISFLTATPYKIKTRSGHVASPNLPRDLWRYSEHQPIRPIDSTLASSYHNNTHLCNDACEGFYSEDNNYAHSWLHAMFATTNSNEQYKLLDLSCVSADPYYVCEIVADYKHTMYDYPNILHIANHTLTTPSKALTRKQNEAKLLTASLLTQIPASEMRDAVEAVTGYPLHVT